MNAFMPSVVGEPVPFNVTVWGPVVVNPPVLEKVIPPAVVVILYDPIAVTFTGTVIVFAAVKATPLK